MVIVYYKWYVMSEGTEFKTTSKDFKSTFHFVSGV